MKILLLTLGVFCFYSHAQTKLPVALTYEEAHYDSSNDQLAAIEVYKNTDPVRYKAMKREIEREEQAIIKFKQKLYFFKDTIVHGGSGSRIMELPQENGRFITNTKNGVEGKKIFQENTPHNFISKIKRFRDLKRIVNGIEGYRLVLTLNYTFEDGRKEEVEHTLIVSEDWNIPLNYYPFYFVDNLELGNGLVLECITIGSGRPEYTTVQRLVDSSADALADTAAETFDKLKG
jgi:hypothetical protein